MAFTTISSVTSSTTWPSAAQRTDLNGIITTTNANFASLTTGATVLPKTVLTVNGRPVTLTAGNLQLILTDIPDAVSNAYVRSTFASNSYVGIVNTNLIARVAAANLAIQSVYNTVGNLTTLVNASNSIVNTSQISGWIQANTSAVNSAWTANAGAQAVSLNNIAGGLTYANIQLGYLSTYVADLQSNAATQGSNLTTLTANAATQAGQIATISANLGAYQTSINANLGTATTTIADLQSQIGTINSIQINGNLNVGNLFTYIDSLTNKITAANTAISTNSNSIVTANSAVVSYVNAVNSRMVSNVTAANAAIATLLSTINTVSDNLTSYANYANNAISTDATVVSSILANITAANVNIATLTANAATQATSLATLTANAAVQAGLINTVNANVSAANLAIADLQANVGSFENYANTAAVSVQLINANVGAYQIYANANTGAFYTYANTTNAATQANLGAFQTYANITNAATQANLGAFQTYANTTFGTSSYGNTQAAAYLATASINTTGNVVARNVISNGNIAVTSSVARNVYVANVAPISTQGNVGDIWYQTF